MSNRARDEAMHFSEIIRLHREQHGLNKKQLAEKVSVTQPYIVQIENDGKIPGDGVVLRLADALGLDRRELLFSAYRARASEDIRHYFHSIFDDLTPTEEFNQPFIEARKDHFESPDFSLRHLRRNRYLDGPICRARFTTGYCPDSNKEFTRSSVSQRWQLASYPFQRRVVSPRVGRESGGQWVGAW